MGEIDLSPEALQKHREIAKKADSGVWEIWENFPDVVIISDKHFIASKTQGNNTIITENRDIAAHMAATFPNAVIALIDEIKRLRIIKIFQFFVDGKDNKIKKLAHEWEEPKKLLIKTGNWKRKLIIWRPNLSFPCPMKERRIATRNIGAKLPIKQWEVSHDNN